MYIMNFTYRYRTYEILSTFMLAPVLHSNHIYCQNEQGFRIQFCFQCSFKWKSDSGTDWNITQENLVRYKSIACKKRIHSIETGKKPSDIESFHIKHLACVVLNGSSFFAWLWSNSGYVWNKNGTHVIWEGTFDIRTIFIVNIRCLIWSMTTLLPYAFARYTYMWN